MLACFIRARISTLCDLEDNRGEAGLLDERVGIVDGDAPTMNGASRV